MKKITALLSLAMLFSFSVVYAQPGGGNPEARKQKMKEFLKPKLVEQTKISSDQADKVIDIYGEFRESSMKLRRDETATKEDKLKQIKVLQDSRDKKLKAIPLTDEQFKSVQTFYEEQRKQMQERQDRKSVEPE